MDTGWGAMICLSFDDVKEWVERQVTPSLFTLVATIGHDEVFEMVAQGSGRLKEHHKRMIENYNRMLTEMNAES